ncbi:MAG: hypothetical protein WAK95_01280 [Desulfobacterales bacterium]
MAVYFMFGKYTSEAIRASVELNRLTGIMFTTCPALAVEIFDRLVKK